MSWLYITEQNLNLTSINATDLTVYPLSRLQKNKTAKPFYNNIPYYTVLFAFQQYNVKPIHDFDK